MSFLLVFLAGYVMHMFIDWVDSNSKSKKVENQREQALIDLRNFQQNVHKDLSNAQEEFAKMQITKLLYEVFKDILKEKDNG